MEMTKVLYFTQLLFCTIALTMTSCHFKDRSIVEDKTGSFIRLGDLLPQDAVKDDSMGFVGPGTKKTRFLLKRNNIQYSVSVDSMNRITYIETSDLNFISPEGFRVGMNYENINNSKLVFRNFWRNRHYIPLDSGWNISFSGDHLIDETKISGKSPIVFFFKKENDCKNFEYNYNLKKDIEHRINGYIYEGEHIHSFEKNDIFTIVFSSNSCGRIIVGMSLDKSKHPHSFYKRHKNTTSVRLKIDYYIDGKIMLRQVGGKYYSSYSAKEDEGLFISYYVNIPSDLPAGKEIVCKIKVIETDEYMVNKYGPVKFFVRGLNVK